MASQIWALGQFYHGFFDESIGLELIHINEICAFSNTNFFRPRVTWNQLRRFENKYEEGTDMSVVLCNNNYPSEWKTGTDISALSGNILFDVQKTIFIHF